MSFKSGDEIRIRFEGQTLMATVKKASPNSVSLMIEFEGILGGYIGWMPLLLEDSGYIDLLTRRSVTIEKF